MLVTSGSERVKYSGKRKCNYGTLVGLNSTHLTLCSYAEILMLAVCL